MKKWILKKTQNHEKLFLLANAKNTPQTEATYSEFSIQSTRTKIFQLQNVHIHFWHQIHATNTYTEINGFLHSNLRKYELEKLGQLAC